MRGDGVFCHLGAMLRGGLHKGGQEGSQCLTVQWVGTGGIKGFNLWLFLFFFAVG